MEEEGELAADPESDLVTDSPFNPRATSLSLSCASRQPQDRSEPIGVPQTVLLSKSQSLQSLVTARTYVNAGFQTVEPKCAVQKL